MFGLKSNIFMKTKNRSVCYNCYRPETSCMCSQITPIETKTKFIILMHPKEFRKTKNGTGHFTNLSLKNCSIYIGIDFNEHETINKIINDPENVCYVLYPGTTSMNLNDEYIGVEEKTTVIFLIDATWPCSKSILASSPNIDALKKISFTHTKVSQFTFKEQPKEYCLSTIESTLCVLELLNKQHLETIDNKSLKNFLLPFDQMVKYQLSCAL